jgi:Mg/Co/Ni transporter MgtE
MQENQLAKCKILTSWIGGVFACYVVAHFERSLNKLVYLAAFMAIIMGMGVMPGHKLPPV